MGDKRKKDKRRLDVLKESGITMSMFLKKYLCVYDDNFLRAELTHKEVSHLFPHLQRSSFAYILDNPSTVLSGNIVLVVDKNGNCAPYVVANLIEQLEEQGINYNLSNEAWGDGTPETWNKEVCNSYDLESLSTYELEQLMYVLKSSGDRSGYLRARNELVNREDSHRANTISKQKRLRKNRRDDDC